MLRDEWFGGDDMSRGSGVRGNSSSAPGSAGGDLPRRRSRRVVTTVISAVAVILVLIGYGAVVAGQVSRYWLDHHGVLARVTVVRTQTVESTDENGTTDQYYVYVRIPDTDVVVRLEVSKPAFPEGAAIVIRYDPNDPTHAIAVQDAPFPVGLLLYTLFVLALAIIIPTSMISSRRQRERWQAAAASSGWTYEPVGSSLDVSLASLNPGKRPARLDLVTGTRRGMRFTAFNCDVGTGESSAPYRVVAFEMPASFPHLWIHRRSRARVRPKSPGGQLPVVTIGSADFARVFEVRCADAWFAGSVLEVSMQQWLLGQPLGSQYELVDRRVFVVVSGKMTAQSLEQTVDGAVAFAQRVPTGASGGIWATSPADPPQGTLSEKTTTPIPSPPASDAGGWVTPSGATIGDDAWVRLENVMRTGGTIRGPVVEASHAGLVVDVGLRGFLPKSMIGARRAGNLKSYVGQELECKVVEVDRPRNNVVLSRRELLV